MRFALVGTLDPAVRAAVVRHGHAVVDDDVTSLADAHRLQLDVITNDRALLDEGRAGVRFTRSLIFLQLPGGEIEQDDAVDRLFARYPRLAPGRLYTVTETRVKVAQLPQPL